MLFLLDGFQLMTMIGGLSIVSTPDLCRLSLVSWLLMGSNKCNYVFKRINA